MAAQISLPQPDLNRGDDGSASIHKRVFANAAEGFTLRWCQRCLRHSRPGIPCIPCTYKLSASERGVDAASRSLLPQRSPNSNLVGSFTLMRPDRRRADPGCAGGFAEARAALFRLRLRLRRDRFVAKRRRRRAAKAEGRAPANRQLLDAPPCRLWSIRPVGFWKTSQNNRLARRLALPYKRPHEPKRLPVTGRVETCPPGAMDCSTSSKPI